MASRAGLTDVSGRQGLLKLCGLGAVLLAVGLFVLQSNAPVPTEYGGLGSMPRNVALSPEEVESLVDKALEARIKAISVDAGKTVFPPVANIHSMDQKRILITGGAGFVGSHLTSELMRQGHIVYVLDNFFTGRRRNVEQWIGHPNFELIHHDVIEPYMLEVDQIYHLACPASPPHYQENPIRTLKTSTLGTINMLGLAKRVNARILLTSTSEIYGDPLEHPQKETYRGNVNTIGPRACYDEGKRVAETMMYAYKSQSNVQVRVARIFNTYGESMNSLDGRVVSNFIIQALQGKPITIYGDGSQTRSFQYVDDLVSGLIKLMNSDYDLPVNLGNPDEYTIKELADMVKELIGSDVRIEYLKGTEDDPTRRKPDITVARRELMWQPKTNVRDGLRKTIAYFRDELERTGKIVPVKPKELMDEASASDPRKKGKASGPKRLG